MNRNKIFQNLALNLYILLSKKYNINKGSYSSNNLSNIAFLLGNVRKKISFDETNKVLNICRTLKQLENGYIVSEEEIVELEELYSYFKKIDRNKQIKVSELEIQFRKLSMKSKDAIVNENEFDSFKEYMHIKRPIEDDFENALFNHLVSKSKSILFIVGNVGDGKSHILSYMMKKHNDIFEKYKIKVHNDATETDSPTSTALQTMKRVLSPFSDENINNDKENRLVVAINLGLLTNMLEDLNENGEYNNLVTFFEETQILSSRKICNNNHQYFNAISFTEQKNFELINGKIHSDFYGQAICKIYSKSESNPFYLAYKKDLKNGMNKLLHKNYEYMLREDFQKSIIYLLTRAEIEYKIIISARMLFNFFFDITMPRNEDSSYDSYLPYLLFENRNKSELLTFINTLDPIKNQTRKIDEVSIEIYHSLDILKKISDLLGEEFESFYSIFQSFKDKQESFNNFINTYLRIKFLMNTEDELFDNKLFQKYLNYYSAVDSGSQPESFFEMVHGAFLKWNGESEVPGFIIKNPGKGSVKVLVEVNLMPVGNYLVDNSIALKFKMNETVHDVLIDYRTFEILYKLNNGYFLKEEDRQIAINFDLFVNNTLSSISVVNKTILFNLETKQHYVLKKFMNKINLSKGQY